MSSRVSKEIYFSYINKKDVFNIGNIFLYVDGMLMSLEEIPSSYIEENYGYTKDEYIDMIAETVLGDLYDLG